MIKKILEIVCISFTFHNIITKITFAMIDKENWIENPIESIPIITFNIY